VTARLLGALLAVFTGAALLAAPPARAARDVPYLSGRVVDDAELLDAGTRRWLGDELAGLERRTGAQVAVLTVPTLEGESVEDFSLRVVGAWKLGREGKDDGVLVLVVPRDRKLRIEVGRGLEEKLGDAAAGRIIRDVMAPAFKAGAYDRGLRNGVQAVMDAVEGKEAEAPGDPSPASAADEDPAPEPSHGIAAADLDWPEKILFGAFIFGILGLFTVVGICTPGVGWFLYAFLIPFWGTFPMVILGSRGALGVLGMHVVGYPIAKLLLARTDWYRRGGFGGGTGGRSRGGGWISSPSSSSSFFSSSSSSSGSSGSSFSGGGGSFGGRGASGSW
jgi:uncharacterized protein